MLRTLLVLCLLASPAWAQDVPPTPPPQPVALTIEGAEKFEQGDFIDFEAKGVAEKVPIKWVLEDAPSDLTKAPTMRFRDGDKRKVEWSFVPGTWRIRVSVVAGEEIVEDFHTFTVAGAVTPPPGPDVPPVKPLSLAQLAGDKAAPIGQVYSILLADIGKKLTTIAMYSDAEQASLSSIDDLIHNPAIPEIRKRTLGKTLDQLKPILEAVIAELSTPVVSPATSMVYIYEKDKNLPPSAVMAGINRVNRETKIRATTFEEDTPDGDGDTPDQYKVALKAAQEAGLPALVVTANNQVIKVVKNPTTADQVWGAAQ